MPDLDGTGPLGRGPRAAGRRGRCFFLSSAPVEAEEETAPVTRGAGLWGCGRGFRAGRARRRW
ncbi:MAG: DUF5320 domain-containing protein [Methanomicrobiales archaeon]|nr:DUF5320 domain-containing protein [Methanomicrobiales archaeon]